MDGKEGSGSDRPSGRRAFLATGAAVALGGVAGCAGAPGTGTDSGATVTDDPGGETPTTDAAPGDGTATDDTATPTDETEETPVSPTRELPASVDVEPLATGFVSPVDFVSPAGLDRQFVVDQPGQLYLIEGGQRREDPYLDLSDRMLDVRGGYTEQGLLGAAAHPEFADNGRLYVRYSSRRREGTPSGYSHTFVLSELTVDPTAASATADSERVLLEVPQPQSNHNAGSLAFGPDGLLYVGVGDGGGANDVGRGHVEDWYETNDGGNGQDVVENLLGSVLRIDVDREGGVSGDADLPYGIPEDNPLVGRDGFDEQYAWGFRNPWRMSFWGDWLVVADVGQNRFEEVDVVERGGNYGWNVREGDSCFGSDRCPTTTPDGAPLLDPVVSYPHTGEGDLTGVAVVGGYGGDGAGIPGLVGRYVFADWRAKGRLFVATPAGEGPWDTAAVPFAAPERVGKYVLAFGRDPDGTLYVLTTDQGSVYGSSGAVHRLVTP